LRIASLTIADRKEKKKMEIKKAELKSFDAENYTASVCMSGGYKAYLEEIAVARNLPAAEMTNGRKVIIVFFDENNPKEAVIAGVYG
jgi:hypothetical protein